MNEIEYDLIDELYFVTSFPEIKKLLTLPDETLCLNLQLLIQKGFIKTFYPDPDTEIEFKELHFGQKYPEYYFLATKAGLIAHNSR